jgi:hypothetical protein
VQKETEEQETSEAKTEEQGTKAEKPKPQVRLALPSRRLCLTSIVSAPRAHTTRNAKLNTP